MPDNALRHYTVHRFDLDRTSGNYRAVCSCGWRGPDTFAQVGEATPAFLAHKAEAPRMARRAARGAS